MTVCVKVLMGSTVFVIGKKAPIQSKGVTAIYFKRILVLTVPLNAKSTQKQFKLKK